MEHGRNLAIKVEEVAEGKGQEKEKFGIVQFDRALPSAFASEKKRYNEMSL